MRKVKVCYELLLQGEVLTDKECLMMLKLTETLAYGARSLGERFFVFAMEAERINRIVDDICWARGLI